MAWKRFEKKRRLSPSQMHHCRASRQRLDARGIFSQRIEIAYTACFTSKDREQDDKRKEKLVAGIRTSREVGALGHVNNSKNGKK